MIVKNILSIKITIWV